LRGKHLGLPRLCWLIGIGGKESNGVLVPVKGSERNDWYVRNLGGEAKISTQVQGESSRLTARGSHKDSNAP
jgi:hypothetical protein